MNTTINTKPQKEKKTQRNALGVLIPKGRLSKRMNSAALMRRDQQNRGARRLGVIGDERTTPKANQRHGEFGTIGSLLTRPAR